MLAPIKLKHIGLVMIPILTLFISSLAMAEEAKSTPTNQDNLTFLDDQQTWRDSEVNSYQEWMKRNPRYAHPMFQSQWNAEHGASFVDSTPDPHYRPWSYRQSWFNRGAVTNVRGRILWVNDRYPTGKYYSSKGTDQTKSTTTPSQEPKADATAPAQGK